MNRYAKKFDSDPYPGAPKILFVAAGSSSHTLDWINLLQEGHFNVRLFATQRGHPPHDWPFRTYISYPANDSVQKSTTRYRFYPPPSKSSLFTRIVNRIRRQIGRPAQADKTPEQNLIGVLESWQPDIVQCLSFLHADVFYKACRRYNYDYSGVTMAMIWGAPDIKLRRKHPKFSVELRSMIASSDYVFSDTEQCMDFARELGLREEQIPDYYLFPGAGGVDVTNLTAGWVGHPPSIRRMLIWPKTYNNSYTAALPVLEAIRLCWEDIQPCELVIPNMTPLIEEWFYTLPEDMQNATRMPPHMAHQEFQELMSQARVMLAPSLMDGLPNVLVDALACGAFPIVSPLGGLTPILKHEENTLFARNLYPQEIAEAITRAMQDDALVDAAAHRNLEVVRRIADRKEIRRQVIHIYNQALQAGKQSK